MKWNLKLFRHDASDDDTVEDLSEHRKQAERALAEAQRRQPEVSRISRSLREMRQKNHFAELIQQTFREST